MLNLTEILRTTGSEEIYVEAANLLVDIALKLSANDQINAVLNVVKHLPRQHIIAKILVERGHSNFDYYSQHPAYLMLMCGMLGPENFTTLWSLYLTYSRGSVLVYNAFINYFATCTDYIERSMLIIEEIIMKSSNYPAVVTTGLLGMAALQAAQVTNGKESTDLLTTTG